MDLFVYYDVPLPEAATLGPQVVAMQSALDPRPARARLLRRAQPSPHAETWMEVYEGVPADFERALDVAATRCGLVERTGQRHVERFVEHEAPGIHDRPS